MIHVLTPAWVLHDSLIMIHRRQVLHMLGALHGEGRGVIT